MTKFLYIADTHLGADPMGYQQQPGYPEQLTEILHALREDPAALDVDFILHGGDMVDSTTEGNLVAATHAFDLPVPVFLCLGNHDLTAAGAAERWQELAPRFFLNGTPDYTVTTPDCVIHVVPNQWCEESYYWDGRQDPHLSATQRQDLSERLQSSPDLPHILLTHSPAHGLPSGQTGRAEPYHSPPPRVTAQLTELAAAHPALKCVLGAHNHMNMHVVRSGVSFVTVSALVETPFEFKRFEVDAQHMKMSTAALRPALSIDAVYDVSRSFVQGRVSDRSIARTFAR